MPINLYTQDEVEVYTRALARAYNMIRDEPATNEARFDALKEIEKVLGWKGPPPVTAKPQSDDAARKLYERSTDNDPTVHCNRFPAWSELSEGARAEWRLKAKAL